VRERYALDAAEGEAASLGVWRAGPTSEGGRQAARWARRTAVRRRAGDGECRPLRRARTPARAARAGDFLMRWSLAQPHAARACPRRARTITVRTRVAHPAADALYARYGLRENFAE